jgi:shikimate dehydrogenase
MGKKFTIFGNPVEHSISPRIHNNALKCLGIDGEYSKTLIEDGTTIKDIFLNNFDGANVTVPHKEIAFELCDEVRGIANEIKAVNTLVNENGKMIGYNTDAPGFYKFIQNLPLTTYHLPPTTLLLGAGGSAKAIAIYLKQQGLNVSILNRSEKKLEFFKQKGFTTYTWDTFKPFKTDIVINTTSAGLKDQTYPAPIELLNPTLEQTLFAVDIIYGKQTPFLQLATSLNKPTKDGKEMLLYQGVLAFNLFFNNVLNEDKITTYMKVVL